LVLNDQNIVLILRKKATVNETKFLIANISLINFEIATINIDLKLLKVINISLSYLKRTFKTNKTFKCENAF